jgi:hypothetical protein
VPWTSQTKRFVTSEGWEAMIFADFAHHEVQLVTINVETVACDDASLRAALTDASDRDEPYGAQLFAVGRDA